MANHTFRNRPGDETLDAFITKFERLLERMQSPAARKGMEAAFNATPEALGRAAAQGFEPSPLARD